MKNSDAERFPLRESTGIFNQSDSCIQTVFRIRHAKGNDNQMKKIQKWLFIVLMLVVPYSAGVVSAGSAWQQSSSLRGAPLGPMPAFSVGNAVALRPEYDVIVAGTDPEGITAAVAAARNGLKVLLVDAYGRKQIGGLMTNGWLSSIDMNRDGSNGTILNKGLFSSWYRRIEGDSFSVVTALGAFQSMVQARDNIEVLLPVKAMKPWVMNNEGKQTVIGLMIQSDTGVWRKIRANAVIDATQDADIAAAAGVPYTFGREDVGKPNVYMASTLAFQLNGITPVVWQEIRKRLKNELDSGATRKSAWGYKELYQYFPNNQRLKMRGLNIGLQNNQTGLVNALLIFDVNPLSAESKAEAMRLAEAEIPDIIRYIQELFPEFTTITYGGHAPELYVRESRHIVGEYRLSVVDLLENRDHWDRIAFGSYPVDLQPTSPEDNGDVLFDPIKYAIPFRTLVPKDVDGMLVVGRAASYDALPHGSARIIPVGMATGEAAGVAVKVALDRKKSFRQMTTDRQSIEALQARLQSQGVELKPFRVDKQAYEKHPYYEGMKWAVSFGLHSGGYTNDFRLDDPSTPYRFAMLLIRAKAILQQKLPNDLLIDDWLDSSTLSVSLASYALATALAIEATPDTATDVLLQKGVLQKNTVDQVANPEGMTLGETFMLFRDLINYVQYEKKK
jgi:hypothetical protein